MFPEIKKLSIYDEDMAINSFVKDIEAVKKYFPWQPTIPEWGKYYLLLIKTRRRNKHYIVKGLSYVGKFRVNGFDKFKVIGYCELP